MRPACPELGYASPVVLVVIHERRSSPQRAGITLNVSFFSSTSTARLSPTARSLPDLLTFADASTRISTSDES